MWKFQDFLLLRFYVKLILVILKPSKMPFWPFEQLWILHFWEFVTLSSVKCFQKSKFKTSEMVEMAVFDLLKSAKIDFTKNLSTVENPQSKFSIRLHWSVLNYNSWFYRRMYDGWYVTSSKTFMKLTSPAPNSLFPNIGRQ